MSALRVLAISASPAPSSKSSELAGSVLSRLERQGVDTIHVLARGLEPAALLAGDQQHPSIVQLAREVERAHGVVLVTPIYKASYSGLLKVVLDVLPQFALAGKVVLPLATGGSPAHVLALDYGLRPVLQSMGARHIVQSHFISDAQITRSPFALDPSAEAPMIYALNNFIHSLTDDDGVRWLGHPRPPQVAG